MAFLCLVSSYNFLLVLPHIITHACLVKHLFKETVLLSRRAKTSFNLCRGRLETESRWIRISTQRCDNGFIYREPAKSLILAQSRFRKDETQTKRALTAGNKVFKKSYCWG